LVQAPPSPGVERVLLPGFEIDFSRSGLRRAGGEHVELRPRSLAVLRLLAANLGQLVTKDEIMAKVWDDAVVTEDSLTQCISDIRRAIDDSERKTVRTLPRRGYMLVGEQSGAADGPVPDNGVAAAQRTPPAGPGQAGDAASPLLPRQRKATAEIRYAKSGDTHIAYQVTGDGPVDIVFVQGYVTHLEIDWEDPRPAWFFERLGTFSRLIRFDKRGTGLSDRVSGLATLEERMDDVRAVMDAVGSKRAILLGASEGGPMSVLFCATYPQRVQSLILYGAMARSAWAADNPWGRTAEQLAANVKIMEEKWGQGHSVDWFAPSLAGNPEYRQWRGRLDRAAASPGAAIALMRMNFEIDVRHVLPTIGVPTLVVHRTGDRMINIEHGRYIARQIPNAKYVELPGEDHAPWVGDTDAISEAIRAFATGTRNSPEPDLVLATILCTDIVDAATHTRQIGAGAWAQLLARLREMVRQQLAAHRGREVDAGDAGLRAVFDGPARAVRCGQAIVDAANALGIRVRVGVHTGECEVKGATIDGPAVRIGAQVAATAAPGEVLVSSTVRDLTAGAGLHFEARGERAFAGLPGTWTLLAAV